LSGIAHEICNEAIPIEIAAIAHSSLRYSRWVAGGMAGITRDAVSFNLVENENPAWADNASFSIGVSDLDATYEQYRGITARVGPLEMQPWGRREFHIIVPSGVCFQFYSWNG
jgi:hypothetical protein